MNVKRSTAMQPSTVAMTIATSSPTDTDLAQDGPEDEKLKDLQKAQSVIRAQAEQIMAWKKAYSVQREQHNRQQKEKTDQLSYLTSQLLLLESRLIKKQKQIANILYQREMTIYRQQKIIDSLSSRLVEHGLIEPNSLEVTTTDFDSLNDSDSAVVLEDIDTDTYPRRRLSDITIARSISDAIDPSIKYGVTRRSNCFLRRPDILETVYSVEEDSEQQSSDVSEKRDKFKNRSLQRIDGDNSTEAVEELPRYSTTGEPGGTQGKDCQNKQKIQTSYNRVMLNHRAVTKVKDVKYKRINKAKSKSLEELRGRLRHWVDRGTSHHYDPSPAMAAKTFA